MTRLFPSLILTAWATATVPHAASQEWPDPVANHVIPYQSSGLTHGPVLGKPTATSMRVWVRTREAGAFEVVYDTTLPLGDESPSVAGSTLAEQDNTGWVDITGLEPGTRYHYGIRHRRFIADTRAGMSEPWPSFRTLPDPTVFADEQNNPDGAFNFSFSISSCSRQRTPLLKDNFGIYSDPPAWRTIYENHRDEIAFNIVNGDYTYEERNDGTAAGLEENYKLHLERSDNMANFMRYVPQLFTYDDHEVFSNLDGAGEVGLGAGDYLRRDPALSVWEYYAQWANFDAPHRGKIRHGDAEIKAGSDVLFDPQADFSTLRPEQVSTVHVGTHFGVAFAEEAAEGAVTDPEASGGQNAGVYGLVEVLDENRLRVEPAFEADGEAAYSVGSKHYYDKKIGNTHFFFLDTRGNRSKFIYKKRFDESRFILGEEQLNWFLEGAQATDADFIIAVSSCPLTIFHSAYHVRPDRGTKTKGDGWAGYVHEREQMLPVLDAIEKPVLFFTGDLHSSFSVQVTDNVWEMMVGPLNSSGHPIGTAGLPPFGGWFDSQGRDVKVKWLGSGPDNVHYSRLRSTFYAVVSVNSMFKAGTPQGSGYQYIPYDEPQLVVQWYDGYSGKLAYAEGISTADAKPKTAAPPKVSRWPKVVAEPSFRDPPEADPQRVEP